MSSLPVIALMGPTASGKSELAMALADALNGEIVSVDSAQVYQGMDIGTAKPSASERRDIPHHLLDVLSPTETYSADDFVRDARTAVAAIQQRGRVPIMAGGTMLYFRAFLAPLADLPASDPMIRSELEEQARQLGIEQLHARLAALDAEAAEQIHPNNRQRVLRALEVYRVSGCPISRFWREQGKWPEPGDVGQRLPWPIVQLGLMPSDRAALRACIDRRFGAMLSAGLVDEVRGLRELPGLTGDHPSMRSVGYRQVWSWLDNEITVSDNKAYEVMVARAQAASRQLAKRQLTWLRGWRNLTPFDTIAADLPGRVMRFLKHEFPSLL